MKLLKQFLIVLLVSLWVPIMAFLPIVPLALWGYRPEGGASLSTALPVVAWLLLWFCLIWAGSIVVSIPIWLIAIRIDSTLAFIFAFASFFLVILLASVYFAAPSSNGMVWGFLPLPQTALQVGILLGTLVTTASLPSWVFLAATHLRRAPATRWPTKGRRTYSVSTRTQFPQKIS